LLVLGDPSEVALATVRALVARGTQRVTLAGREPEALAAAEAQVAAAGCTAVDVLRFDELAHGGQAALIDNVFGRGYDIDAALLGIDFTADAAACVSLIRRFRLQGHGVIIALPPPASECGRVSEHTSAVAKAGLDVYCRTLGQRLQGSGVGVLLVRSGFTYTKLTTDRRSVVWVREPSEVASAIVDGLRRRERVVWVPRAARWMGLFLRLVPGWLLGTAERFLD
jgi:decaprenylphospho-beta-D-erythro-pentofuranosid-2-ulose 2-reductase